MDIILSNTAVGQDYRLIVDIDFRSNVEIAKAQSRGFLPTDNGITLSGLRRNAGTVAKLNKFLQLWLMQLTSPLNRTRCHCLHGHHVQSKWYSPHKRHLRVINQEGPGMFSLELHRQCDENLTGQFSFLFMLREIHEEEEQEDESSRCSCSLSS